MGRHIRSVPSAARPPRRQRARFLTAHCRKLVLVILLGGLPSLRAQSEAELQSDGTVVAGGYRAVLNPDAVIRLVDPDGLVYDLFFPVDYPAGITTAGKTVKLVNPRWSVDEKTKSVTLRAEVEPPNGEPFDLIYSLAIVAPGGIRISVKAAFDQPIDRFLGLRGDVHVTREAVAGGTVAAGGEAFDIPAGPPGQNRLLKQGPAETVVLHAGNPRREMTFTPVVQGDFSISDQNTLSYRPPFLAMTFARKGNELVYDIGLPVAPSEPASPDTHAGIDFWKSGRLHMPQYGQSRNLVQNAGFESGFAYWHWGSLGRFPTEPASDEYSVISTGNPQSGRRALALRGEPGQTPADVATFAIPVEKNQDYTLSFYARSSRGTQNLQINAQGFFTPPFMIWKSVEVDGLEWKRHTLTFRTTHSVLTIGFGASPSMHAGDWIFVDSVQLEKGSQATGFVTKPVEASVTSDFRGNLWEPGQNPHAELHLSGSPGSRGNVAVTCMDFFGKETAHGRLEFVLDASGEAALPLPWAGHLPSGLHIIRMNVATSDGFSGTDTSRLTVMRFLENRHAHKDLFSVHFSNVTGSWKRQAEFMKRAGIGSTILFDPESDAFHRILELNRILHFSSIFEGGQGFKKEMGWDQKDGFDLTPAQLKVIEDLSCEKARNFPGIRYWKLNNEPETGAFIDNPANLQKMADVLLAARRGVLRGNPEAVLVGSDPANMFSGSGIAFVDAQLAVAGNRKIYDIPAIHPYRERPESPDLDSDTELFLNMLERHSYPGEVWFTEGIYHQNQIVPEWSLDAHKGCSSDHFRAGALSYDLGWGEKMAAAYTARSWLVGLKYGSRVRLFVDWGFFTNSSSDVDMTPCAMVFASNTLGHLLGDAVFKAEANLGHDVRCYVFERKDQTTVAAIWSHSITSDKGNSSTPVLDVSALTGAGADLQYADFMGNIHPLTKDLKLGPFPVFILGKSVAGFLENLRKCSLKPETEGDEFAGGVD